MSVSLTYWDKINNPLTGISVGIYPSLFQAHTFPCALRAPGNMGHETTQGIFPQIYLLEGIITIISGFSPDLERFTTKYALRDISGIFTVLWDPRTNV